MYYQGRPKLPISVDKLAQFIVHLKHQGLKPATISSKLSALSYIHNLKGYPNPTQAFVVQKLLVSLRKQTVQDKRLPIVYDTLVLLVQALSGIGLPVNLQLMFRSMFLLAFFALLRIGEMAATSQGTQNIIRRENVSFGKTKGSVSSAQILFQHFKHSNGQSASVNLTRNSDNNFCPVTTLYQYLKQSGFKQGPLFMHPCGCPVSAGSFTKVLRKCLKKLRLSTKRYTTHSFRIGGATHAYNQNFTEQQIRTLGRWRSNAFMKYIRPRSLTAPCPSGNH